MDTTINKLFKAAFLTFIALSISCITPTVLAMTTAKIKVKGRLPAGIFIKNNKVNLKEGYAFKKVSKSRVNVIYLDNGGITGSFDCTCNGTDGGCDVITTPTSVSCAVSSCKSSCYMITTIPGTSTPGSLYWVR